MRQKPVFLLSIAIVIIVSSPAQAQIRYNLTDLGEGTAYSINNSGQVVGTAPHPSWELPNGSFVSVPNAVIFDSTGDGNNIYLGEGRAYAINNNGQIVGYSGIFAGQQFAALFDPTDDGNNFELRLLSDNGHSCAYSISDSGQIVGYSNGAVLFDPTGDGNNIDLGNGRAYSINNNGQIVGISDNDLFPFPFPLGGQATLFDPNGTANNINLDPNGSGSPLSLDYSRAFSINNNGQIVGYAASQQTIFITNPTPVLPSNSFNGLLKTSTTTTQSDFNVSIPFPENLPPVLDFNSILPGPNSIIIVPDPNYIIIPPIFGPPQHATLFDPTGDGNNIDMGTLPDGGNSCAYSINDKGQIVGFAYTASNKEHAVMFDPTGDGNNIDLNELIDPALGWTLIEARCINDNGWIVGSGTDPNGQAHAFLLTPPIEADIEIHPNTLNLQSKGRRLTSHIHLPEQYAAADVNSSTVLLADEIQPEEIILKESQNALIARFTRSQVQQMLIELQLIGPTELAVSFRLNDGTIFEGTDTINIIDKGGGN